MKLKYMIFALVFLTISIPSTALATEILFSESVDCVIVAGVPMIPVKKEGFMGVWKYINTSHHNHDVYLVAVDFKKSKVYIFYTEQKDRFRHPLGS